MSDAITRMLESASRWDRQIENLRQTSPLYPQVLKVDIPGTVFYSTLLRLKFNNIWYLRHFVESYKVASGSDEEREIGNRCLERLHASVYMHIIFNQVFEQMPDPEDQNQQDERERLIKTYQTS